MSLDEGEREGGEGEMEGRERERERERDKEGEQMIYSLISITNPSLEVSCPSSSCRNRSFAVFVNSSDSPL